MAPFACRHGAMARVLRDSEIPDDFGIGVEFGIPQTSKRVDFILSGEAQTARRTGEMAPASL